jgi:hypothetical protein
MHYEPSDYSGSETISSEKSRKVEPSVSRDLLTPPAVGLCQAWWMQNVMASVRQFLFKVCRIAKVSPRGPMKNGLYSVHVQMLDGVKGRASGVIVVRDGVILGGDPYFWSSAPTPSGTEPGRAISSPISTRPTATAWHARFSAAGRSRRDFPEHFGTTIPKSSAHRWSAAEASVFARHCAG